MRWCDYETLTLERQASVVVRDCSARCVLRLADKAQEIAIDLAVQEVANCALDRCAVASLAWEVHTIRKHITPEEPWRGT
jgi:hypothetical protein